MSRGRTGFTAVAMWAVLAASAGQALAADRVDVGKNEYENACAVCHGALGKGDGPMQTQLTRRVPDLTVLARANNGVFPFDLVYQTIDGRREVGAHGSRDMPVWGRTFRMQSSVYFENHPVYDRESAARSRILALTEYVFRLQGK
ncbi:MAG: c-type cytochrome [Burkholderiales bacterium]|nr:c-type cytochrome [Burkholderiales bacterium]